MRVTKLRFAVISVVLITGGVAPWLIQRQSEIRLREKINSLQTQLDQLSQQRTEDERASNAHAQAGARERMAEHHLARQAERQAELAHFVLEKLAQRLEQLEVQRLGQAADIVVRLDGGGLLGLRAGRLDHVRVDRA